uniref:Late embryogenesis abundant protein LEA-2 subgroup domain-containing protein n=1 Tax=Brassica campestris TaxID=3711 RepID=M4CG42_BRACM
MNTDDKKEKAGAPMLAAEAAKSNADMETQPPNGGGRKRNRKICICVSLLILLLLIFIVLLVLGLTLFKPKNPTATVDSVAVERLRTSVDVLNLKANLNLTLNAHLALKNPNRVGFSFGATSALLNYKGQLVGEAPLPANRVGPQKTLRMNVTLTLMADRLLSESQVFSDVMSGSIPVNAFVKVAGKVSVFNMFKIKVKSSASCDVTISVSSRNVTSQHYNQISNYAAQKHLNVTPNGALLHGFLYQHRSSNIIFIIALTLALPVYKSRNSRIRIQSAALQGIASSIDVQLSFTLKSARFL